MKKFRYLIHLLHVLLFLYKSRIRFKTDRLVGDNYGLCYYLEEFSNRVYKDPIKGYKESYIPEFESKYLTGSVRHGYWWDECDEKSRLKAFEKLIVLYKSKIKNLLC